MVKTLVWMMCSKHIKVILKTRFRGIEEIELIDDILSSYSHSKVSKLFSVSNIKVLFQLFVIHGREEFLSSFKGEQKVRYEEAFDELTSNFNNTL